MDLRSTTIDQRHREAADTLTNLKHADFVINQNVNLSNGELGASDDELQHSDAKYRRYSPKIQPILRKNRIDETKLPPDEAERILMRRVKNRLAASRCRDKRVQLEKNLKKEMDGLEDENSRLQNVIRTLRNEKEQLDYHLQAHESFCGKRFNSSADDKEKTVDHKELVMLLSPTRANDSSNSNSESNSGSGSGNSSFSGVVGNTQSTISLQTPIQQAIKSESNEQQTVVNGSKLVSASESIASRPLSLAVGTLGSPLLLLPTPSSGNAALTCNLINLLSGSTGLTPITGLPSGS